MTILVTGATGNVGRNVVEQLVQRGATVRALVRDPAKAALPAGVEVVQGDLLDPDAVRGALAGVSRLFLLNAVAPDEFTQALIALNLAREAGVARVVYLSVIHSDVYDDVPHFAGKYGVERLLDRLSGAGGIEATVLRPTYYIDNDRMVTDVVKSYGVYPMPIGAKGLAMIDPRDIGEIAALELLREDHPGGTRRLNLVGPDTLTGAGVAAIWSDVLGRPIAYGGDDTAPFEQNLRNAMPVWMAYDMRLMAGRFQSDGMVPGDGDVAQLTALLGRPLRTYREFAATVAAE